MSNKHFIESVGKLILEKIANVTSLVYDASNDRGRMLYDQNTNQVYYGNNFSTSFTGLNDIPLGAIVLFESDTAVIGYSLLTNVNDYVAYVTIGSSAGGATGGSDKGTWNRSHQHGMQSHGHSNTHSHAIPHTHASNPHFHMWCYYSGANNWTFTDGGSTGVPTSYWGNPGTGTGFIRTVEGDGHSDYPLGNFYTQQATANFGGASNGSQNETVSSASISDNNTGPGGTVNTWRPEGINFTRQQRV